MKGSSMNTHMGNITIDNEVIAQYAGSVAVECFGIVGMAGFSAKDERAGAAKAVRRAAGIHHRERFAHRRAPVLQSGAGGADGGAAPCLSHPAG